MTEPNKPTEAEVEGTIRYLSSLLRRVSANSTREIDNLISELQTLRDRLHADSSGVERVIVKYEALTQSIIQLTKIIADGVTHVKTVPDAASFSE
jgi:chemotaxis protein histidine kinase CheA